MTKETISNGVDSYNKKLAEAEDYYKGHLQDNLKRIKETSQKIEEFASGKYDDEIASNIIDDYILTKDNTKELKKAGKKVKDFTMDRKADLELSKESEEVFKNLDQSINKTNNFIKKSLGEAYDALSYAKSATLAGAKALGLSTGEKSFRYEFYNPDIYKLTHAGPDFMSNMFTAYLSNTSWAKNSEITQRASKTGAKYQESEINKVFAFRVVSLNLPRLAAKEGQTFTFANQQIKKISAISSNEYRGSITVRLDNKLGIWFLDTVGGASQGSFGQDDTIETVYPKVFFPNGASSYGNNLGDETNAANSFDHFWFPSSAEESVINKGRKKVYGNRQNLIVSMSNIGGFRPDDIMTLVEWIKESKIEAQGLQKWLDALNATFEEDQVSLQESPYALSYENANFGRNIYPVYIFKNVRFINKPSISLNRDNSDTIDVQFDFIYNQVIKAFGKVKVSKAQIS